MNPTVERTTTFLSGHAAMIRPSSCDGCETCRELCAYSAIAVEQGPNGEVVCRVDPLHCEGCGVCVHFCPRQAIDFTTRTCGQWYLSRTRFGPLVHASLGVGAENSGKLVTLVREQARRLAQATGYDLILMDGPPGIGCPVTASLTGVDLALLVTEPGVSGLHDLKRIVELADHFRVPVMVCINKYDLNLDLTDRIEEFCQDRGLPLVGSIPFDPLVNDAQAAGRSLVDFAPASETAKTLIAIWRGIEHRLADLSLAKG
jgi:MinD superfamily P-loop ATPase